MALLRTLILLALPLCGWGQCCTHTINMQDTYGDGWNGASLTVLVNGQVVGTYSAIEFASSATFNICQNDALELQYTPGDYENENSYQILDPNWNLVHSDGPNPLVGSVYTGSGDCNAPPVVGGSPCTAFAFDSCIVSSNVAAPSSDLQPNCASYQGSDVWFTMTVPASGNLTFLTDSGSLNDTGLAIWQGNDCSAPTLLGCDDDGGNDYFSQLSVYDLQEGTTLYIQVFGYGGATGSFRLCATDLGTVTLDSSELPLFFINTQGQTIVQNTKINCLLDIKYNGTGNTTAYNDPPNIYSGNVGIEIRGATSAGFPQRPYSLETRTATGTNNNVSLLGMPTENDWVLLSNYNDRSLIRNPLAFDLFSRMGNYGPRTRLCEVLIDSVYKGIYVFGEKIKRDNNRVDIAKLTALDIAGDSLTGGYILQQNYWDNSNSFQSNFSPIDHPTFDVHFLYQQPNATELLPVQKNYIASYIDSLETALYSAEFADTASGYRKYLDTRSFIDYFLINELSRNNDGFKKSVFYHKDKFSNGGKLKAGPVWDFDWAWKTMGTCDLFSSNDGSGWAHLINDCPTDNYSTGWYVRLMQDTSYNNELRCVYEGYREGILSTASINQYIDSVGQLVQFAQARHFQKWPLLGVSGFAPEVNPVAITYAAELDTLKAWINTRLAWLDENIPGTCYPPIVNGLVSTQPAMELQCYPNPSSGLVHFKGDMLQKGPCLLTIFDAVGRIVSTENIARSDGSHTFKFNSKGVYFYELNDSEGKNYNGKIVVVSPR